jgi:hypothetical protein
VDSGFFGTVNLCFLYPPSVAGGYYELIGDCAPATTTTTTTTTGAPTTTTTTSGPGTLDWDCVMGTCTNVGTGLGIYTSYSECISYGCEGTTTTAAPGEQFTIQNAASSGQITDITTNSGAYFYFVNTGSFPITAGQVVGAGGASLTASSIFVEISSYSSSGCLYLFINGGFDSSLGISGAGTYEFPNKTFTTSDTVLITFVDGTCS